MPACNKPSSLQPFMFEGATPIRVVRGDDGKPLFVAKDVAEALGYVWNGASRIAHVPEEWRRVTSVVTLRGDAQDMAVLTDQGLYFFLGRSDKPKSLPFQKWIAGEVVPSIMETGSYSVAPKVPADVEALLAMPKSRLLRLAADLADKVEEQERQLAAQQPDVDLARNYLDTKGLVSLSTMVRNLRLPYRLFFERLSQDGICFKESEDGPWVPYADFRNRGLLVFQVRVPKRQPANGEKKAYGQTMVTPAGVKWFSQKYGHLSVPVGTQMPLLEDGA